MNKENNLYFGKAEQLILQSKEIILVSHEFTDADDLGGMLALEPYLKELGKQVHIVAKGGVSENLIFLPGSNRVKENPPETKGALVVFSGCGEILRTGFEKWDISGLRTINIDHHPDNKMFGTVNLVDPQAGATCEIVYYFIKYLKKQIIKPAAINLLTGIFFDTGGFRHASTSPEILEITAELVRKGARIDRIASYYFGHTELAKLYAWAKAFENAHFDPEQKIMYSVVTEEELKEIGAKPEHLEGVAEILNTVPEAKFSMFLKQRGDEIRASLRSENYKGVDVSKIAHTFGGGGHKLAAGFKLKGKIEKTNEGWKIT